MRAATGLRERKKLRLRAHIIEATLELVEERGYEKTTIEEVVRRVEISQPTFYKYFSSKDAVLREVAGERISEWAVRLYADPTAPSSAAGRLRCLYGELGAAMLGDTALWRAIVLADALNPMRAIDAGAPTDPCLVFVEGVLRKGQGDGEIKPHYLPAALAEKLVAIQILSCLAWATEQLAGQTLPEVLDENVEFFMAGARV